MKKQVIDKYNDIIERECRFYNISIDPIHFKSSCGRAWPQKRKIKIPLIISAENFMVALHEIAHIRYGSVTPEFKEEYLCEMMAIELAKFHDVPENEIKEYTERAKRYVLYNICKAHNRGLKHEKIDSKIREFLSEVNFDSWIGRKVYLGDKGLTVKLKIPVK